MRKRILACALAVPLAVAVGSVSCVGCGRDAARSAPKPQAPTRATVAGRFSELRQPLTPPHHVHRSAKDTPHEAFLSTYNSPEEGILIRYPRNYLLEEGEVREHSFFLKTQEDLDIEQPGATLLATVLIPEDGYPNTTFVHGSLQLIINETQSENVCQQTGVGGSNAKRSDAIAGVPFHWSEQEGEIAGSKTVERTYTGFSRGTCYEFVLTVAAEASLDLDGFNKPADLKRIMKQLEKIVSSAQIFDKTATPAPESSKESADRL